MPKDAPPRTDPERFEEVAAIAKRLGMRVSGIVVGDIRVQFAAPWPEFERPVAAEVGEVAHGEEQTEYVLESPQADGGKKLKELRRRSKITFGHVKPDAELLAMEGVL